MIIWSEAEIIKLKIENKALKETLDKTTDLVVDYQERLVKVEESRDELLDQLKIAVRYTETMRAAPHREGFVSGIQIVAKGFKSAIKEAEDLNKAETQKEQETK